MVNRWYAAIARTSARIFRREPDVKVPLRKNGD
jgi:hypothetical protein